MSRQPSRTNESGLVTKFLGAQAAAGGPFSLLGIDAADASDEAVLLGLRDRLEQASRHPEGATPEADEIRLALHAAAAQLLDPRTRESMIERWGGNQERGQTDRQSARYIDESERQIMLLQHDAVMAIAACGGWNERARARLMMLAQARGLGPDLIHVAVSKLESGAQLGSAGTGAVSRPRSGHGSATRVPVASIPGPIPTEASRERRRIPPLVLAAIGVVLIGTLGVLSIVAVVTGASNGAGGGGAVAPTPASNDIASGAAKPDSQGQLFPTTPGARSTEPATAPTSSATTDAERFVQRLTSAVEGLSLDSKSAAIELETLLREAGVKWADLGGVELGVVQRCVVDLMYKSESSELPLRFVDVLTTESASAKTRPGVLRAIWQAGILNRLSRERDLSATVRLAIEDRLARLLSGERPAGDPPFEAGAIALLLASAESIAEEGVQEAWGGWLAAVDAVSRLQPTRRTDLLLAGLTSSIEGFDKQGNARFLAETAVLIPWHREPAAQRWLVARFDGLDTSKDALIALTRAIASKSSVPGVDATMALTTGASEASRRELRDRYAELFGLSAAADVMEIDARISTVISELGSAGSETGSIEESIRAAVAWSRVSEAAWLRWRGVSDRAAGVLKVVQAPIAASTGPQRRGDRALRRDDPPTWARAYLNAGSDIGARTTLLLQYPMSDAHPADAEIVMGEALRGSPAQVRESARLVVTASSTSPLMVNAMLESLPTAPRTLVTAEIIAALTGRLHVAIDRPDWRIETRRLLVERLLELMAAQGTYAPVDVLADLLAESHAVRATSSLDATAPSQGATRPALEDSLAQEREMWRASAEELVRPRSYPDTLAQIQSGAAARSRVASGVIQRVVVSQQEIVRLMGLVVASERPERAPEAWAIVSELGDSMADSRHVGDQVRACERAMARLWELRVRRETDS